MYARFCVSGSQLILRSLPFINPNNRVILPTVLVLITAFTAAGQSSQPGSQTQPPAGSPSPAGVTQSATQPQSTRSSAPIQPVVANGVQASVTSGVIQVTSTEETPPVNPLVQKIERARALAAAHQLPQAATDLENVRASVSDVALRNVASLMLIGIYLEEGNYVRTQALLEEGFTARAAQKDESLRTYFAMAGQTVNGLRTHLARYRSFGINPSEIGLPAEANADLDRVRGLLERLAAQAKEISNEAGRSYDAVALQEDVVGIRSSLARDNDDREKWQNEYLAIREKLASSQAQTSSIGRSALLDAVKARIPNPFATASASASSNNSDATTSASPAQSQAPATTDSRISPQLISTGSLSGRESKRVTPVYPAMARSARVSGTVRVFAIVDENGKIWVTNSEGPSMLKKAAEDAARNWTFPPTMVSGKAVRVAGYLDFDFKL
jgi:TonB family protein